MRKLTVFPQSTLSQIRTQGINRGGLYGFFVKGECIAGTIEDSSASATDASLHPSGTSTPPTSASDTEAPSKTIKKSKTDKKRKRATEDETTVDKPTKASKKNKDPVAAKIAKLSTKEKAEYEARAALKNQTLEQYVLRRIEKKSDKKAPKSGKK
jgi:nucleolar protein TMA23